ncbi:MAG: DUF1349 domain-containing protein [Cyanobacteria bacterium]|jgi:regulation of enolase protein 1 (concanavalin A-like superfamily)|nr:DUF1349 domain-containing protein [Cyanobacteria bacterium GSL.Bin21]
MSTFSSDGGPTIEVWYGDEQQFGNVGIPQTWVNILGNVFDPDGIASLNYSLNGDPVVPLSIGPDKLRLSREGDFNVDPAFADLDGSATDDELVITATDSLGNITTGTVFIDYEAGNTWPQPYTIDWSSVTDIQNVAQVVDGKWAVEGDTVRTLEPGYDRLIAIGETTWDNYEVTSTININEIPSDTDNGVGFIVGWTGHTEDGKENQPKSGFNPYGAIAWYRRGALRITSDAGGNTFADNPITLQEGGSYVFKLRSERTRNNTRTLYSFKVWEEGQSEPDDWTIQKELASGNQQGSIGLLAHRYDASFGDVDVTPITGVANEAPVANNDSGTVAPASTLEIDVLANDSDSDGTLVPSSLSITTPPSNGTVSVDSNGLVSYTHDGSTTTSDSFSYTVNDDDGATSNVATVDLTIAESSGLVFESDDFNSTTLDSRWTVIDPLGDSSVGTTGVGTGDALLELSVPGGTAHDLWNNNKDAVRVMQTATDTDFELEVKHASLPDQKFELQGILVEQDNNDWIRFDTFSDSNFLRIFAATTTDGNSNQRINTNVAPGSADYLRVNRQGDQWRLDYSGDGSNWTTAGSFTHDLNVSQVGTFAGNSGNSPAFTAEVDYFFNTAEPIVPEI